MAKQDATGRTQEQTEPAKPASQSLGREALVVAFPESRVLPVPLTGDPIGRDWLQGHSIEEAKASRQHCVFTRTAGKLAIADCGSRNGTWLNGMRVAQAQTAVDDGALIRIGRTLLIYRRELHGPDRPSNDLGSLVGPFGLRGVEAQLNARLIHSSQPFNVLIHGETGTGKEGLALEIATRLKRTGSYEAINMAAVPADTFESKLFGHVRGAFSGAVADAPGVFGAHDGGAVFLDEIGELPLELQAKLLRFLENRQIEPVGAKRGRQVDVVIIAATNKPLEEQFLREDILARFDLPLELPPLRARAEDIFSIAQALLRRRGQAFDPRQVEAEAAELLLRHPWSRNVRELDAVLKQVGTLDPPPSLRTWALERVLPKRADVAPVPPTSDVTLAQVEDALTRNGGNQSATERELGITHGRMQRLLKQRRSGEG